ncbi:TVP38/TMEM64 family protein [Alkalihalobacillus sp. CinArs1]|uniref:TVP38/TMEM64 family protein n=1 Tax=Alkalihalobacillus sp. CinArs1 TaxID=2995314 RepID=UPI0022DD2BF8|nr:VTT domain-containing protein [Alkalihalobacillus sp. CinArs1]
MNELVLPLIEVVSNSGVYAPLYFIVLHFLRQFIFVPVSVICMAGGVLFGAVYGTIYSVIGITVVSIVFYFLIKRSPLLFNKVTTLKKKWMKKRMPMSVGQIAILRLIPFVHFHFISLCLIEVSRNFKEYLRSSFLTNIPLALMYSFFGTAIKGLEPMLIVLIMMGLVILFHLLRRREWIMKWDEFFQPVR